MPVDLILGTAGHIDHGKTALIKALTGVDCDRLPEEKERGITIDIGFAHLNLGDVHFGIVDVPGHERFIRNMLAGASGIDLALLVVSAGESIKPQTREHLEILKLLGLRHGVVALTKIDLADETTLAVVEEEVRDLVKGTFLEESPIVRTSATTAHGIQDLKQALGDVAARVAAQTQDESFRLAIDRSFVMEGHGTVVTGSVLSGRVRVGDEVEWLPRQETVRVRGLQHHDQAVDEVRRGQRAALNLAGVPHEEVRRGQELATPGHLRPSQVLTVRLHALAGMRRPIKHRTPARLHIGTAEVMASVALLEGDTIEPGEWGQAQLFLDQPATAVWGQPFVLRDSSAERTLGGGQVLQPQPGKIRRRHPEALKWLDQLASDDVAARIEAAAWFGVWNGLDPKNLECDAGIGPQRAAALIADLLKRKSLIEVRADGRPVQMHAERLAELDERILDVLGRLHQENPLLTQHDRRKALSWLAYIGDDGLLQGAVDRLIATGKLVGDVKRIARADFKPKLSANQRKLKDQIVEAHRTAGFQPPEAATFAPHAGGHASVLKDIYEVAVAEGLLCPIGDSIYLHVEVEAELRQRVDAKLSKQPAGLTVSEIRDLLGTTRKFAIPICEYLDRIGVTKRQGDLRVKR